MTINISHKYITHFCIIILLSIILCLITFIHFTAEYKSKQSAGSDSMVPETDKPYVKIGSQEINLWEKNGQYYAFLPSAYKNSKLKPVISGGIDPESVIWMYSENIPAIFIETETGTSDNINQDKDIREPGTITVLESDGNVSLQYGLDYIKGRGNTSFTEFDKKSYQIKLTKSLPLLDMDSGKKWILISNSPDSTLLRNALARNLADYLGLAQSKEGVFADLYLNGEYAGNYYVIEKIEINENRLTISDLEKMTEIANQNSDLSSYETAWTDTTKSKQIPHNPKDITGGYIIERDFEARFLKEVEENGSYFITSEKECFIVRSPEYASENQVAYINDYVQHVENAILSTEGIDKSTGKSYKDLIDINSFVRKYLLEEITANYDGGVASSYFYKDSDKVDGKLYAGPVWDYDVSFGNAPAYLGYISTSPNRLSKLNSHVNSSVWFHNLYQKPEFFQEIVSCYQNEVSPYLTVLADEVLPRLDQLTAASAAMDQVRWEEAYIENGYNGDRKTEIAFLSDYIHGRKNFLDKAWVEQIPVHQITLLIDGVVHGTLYAFDNEPLPELPTLEFANAQFVGWISVEDGLPPDLDAPVQNSMAFQAVLE